MYPAAPTLECLLAIAFQRELAAARRLARQQGMPLSTALVQVMQAVLADEGARDGLAGLIARRRCLLEGEVARRAARMAASRARFLQKTQRATPSPSSWRAWFDGSATPNPGRLGLGGVLEGPAGEVIHISCAAGHGDSNEAEYLALIAVLERAVATGIDELVVHGDSQVVIGDVLGTVPVRGAGLAMYRQRVATLQGRFASLRLVWIPRARNAAADALAQQGVAVAATTPTSLLDAMQEQSAGKKSARPRSKLSSANDPDAATADAGASWRSSPRA